MAQALDQLRLPSNPNPKSSSGKRMREMEEEEKRRAGGGGEGGGGKGGEDKLHLCPSCILFCRGRVLKGGAYFHLFRGGMYS